MPAAGSISTLVVGVAIGLAAGLCWLHGAPAPGPSPILTAGIEQRLERIIELMDHGPANPPPAPTPPPTPPPTPGPTPPPSPPPVRPGPTVPPVPAPPPVTTPPPGPIVPKSKRIYVIGLYHPTVVTAQTTAVLDSTTLVPALRDLGATWVGIHADPGHLRPDVQAVGLPCLLIQDEDGKSLLEGGQPVPLPTEAQIVAMVARLRGRN